MVFNDEAQYNYIVLWYCNITLQALLILGKQQQSTMENTRHYMA